MFDNQFNISCIGKNTFILKLILFAIILFTTSGLWGSPAIPGLSKAYRIINLREDSWQPKSITALNWLGDTLVVAEFGGVRGWENQHTSEGKIWLLTGVLGAKDPTDVSRKEILSGLAQPMGLHVENGEIFIHQKGGNATEIIRAFRNGNTWVSEVFATGWGQNEGFWWHSWPGGLLKKDGYFYFNYSSVPEGHKPVGATSWPPVYKGSLIRLNPENPEEYIPIANGMRTNAALFEGPFGSLMGPDVQGNWKPDNQLLQIQEGRFYGHSHQGQKRQTTSPPAVAMPQNLASNSPGDGAYLKKGPFAGQLLMGDQTYAGINRYHLEEINGELQGTVIDFMGTKDASLGMSGGHPWAIEATPNGEGVVFGCAAGWWVAGPTLGALGMLVPSGEIGFEVLAIRNINPTTMEIEFTKPINVNHARDINRFIVNTWTSTPSSVYGAGAMQDHQRINPNFVDLAPNSNKKVHLKFPTGSLKTGSVVKNQGKLEGLGYTLEFDLNVFSSTDERLYDNKVYYTLNQYGPGKDPIPGCTQIGAANFNPSANDDDGSCMVSSVRFQPLNRGITGQVRKVGSTIVVSVKNTNEFELIISDIKGSILLTKKKIPGEFTFPGIFKTGIYFSHLRPLKAPQY